MVDAAINQTDRKSAVSAQLETSVNEHPQITTGRPYQMCTRTVMDTTDPDITFDDDGVCNHWYEYQRTAAAELLPLDERARLLERSIHDMKAAGRGRLYDCVVGLSGGIDSSYMAYLAAEWGLRPLVVHFDNGWNSELAVSNIEKIVSTFGFDLHTFVMDWPEFRDIQRAYFRASVLDLEVPTDHMIFGALHQVASTFKISHILSSNNTVTEAILPRAWYYSKFDVENLKDIHRRFGEQKLKHFPALGVWQYAYYQVVRRLKNVRILNLVDYNKENAKRTLIDKVGWTDYGGKHHESVFTRFYQGHILPRKFNIDKRKAHLSNLVCSGQMSRPSALSELAIPPYDAKLQQQDKEYVAKKLGFTNAEFELLLSQQNRRHDEFATDLKQRATYFRLMRALTPVTSVVKKLGFVR